MAPIADRRVLESQMLNQEIIRLDSLVKEHLQRISTVSPDKDERWLLGESKEAKSVMDSLQTKIETLSHICPNLVSKADQSSVRLNVERYLKELEENRRQLRIVTVGARKKIVASTRASLITSNLTNEERQLRKRMKNQEQLLEESAKTTEKLSDLLARMSNTVSVSEQHIETLSHSSATLVRAQGEFETTAQHIQTGNKLLSKFEHREMTDKVLIFIALLFYIAVIFYILQKRVLFKFWLF